MNNVVINKESNPNSRTNALDKVVLRDLLKAYPNSDCIYSTMDARDYIAARIRIIDSAKLINVRLGTTSTQAISLMCGWSASTLYNISSPKATKYKGRYQRPSWEHAARLHIVTHGFIHAKYSCPAFFESAKAIMVVE